MTPEKAKTMVFENLNYLDGLCQNRFRHDPTLGELVQCYLLEKLQENDWERIRKFKGSVQFLTYFTVIANRLITQFEREKCGYPRPPSSLPNTPLAKKAFWLLKIKKWNKPEVIQILECMDASIERREIEMIIQTILNQKKHTRFNNHFESVEDIETIAISDDSPENILIKDELQQLKTIIKTYLSLQDESLLPPKMRAKVDNLSTQLNLSDEDWLFIRLYFVEDLSIKKVAERLGLKGDAHKRYHRILKQLQKTFRQLDLSEACAA